MPCLQRGRKFTRRRIHICRQCHYSARHLTRTWGRPLVAGKPARNLRNVDQRSRIGCGRTYTHCLELSHRRRAHSARNIIGNHTKTDSIAAKGTISVRVTVQCHGNRLADAEHVGERYRLRRFCNDGRRCLTNLEVDMYAYPLAQGMSPPVSGYTPALEEAGTLLCLDKQ